MYSASKIINCQHFIVKASDLDMQASVFVLFVSLAAVQSAITKGPTNQLQKVGDQVQLKCITDSQGCDWQKVEGPQSPKPIYRSDRGMLNPDMFDPKRYGISGTESCILNISSLMITDSGRFICLQTKENKEYSKSAFLIVVGVKESCRSNMTNKELVEGDGYSLECNISLPSKSMELPNVKLSLVKKSEQETVVSNGSWETVTPPVVTTKYNSTAARNNIADHSCRASFHPEPKHDFDDTRANLAVCSTNEMSVLYPVKDNDITVSSSKPHKGESVNCTAGGYPHPMYRWNCLKTGETKEGSVVLIEGDVGDKYMCIATNTIKGQVFTANITVEVTGSSGCGSGCVAGVVICTICLIIGIIIVVLCCCWKFPWCLLYLPLHSCKKDKSKTGGRCDAGQALTDPKVNHGDSFNPPKKPPRISENPDRPISEVHYAELRPDFNPRQMQTNPAKISSTVYASVLTA